MALRLLRTLRPLVVVLALAATSFAQGVPDQDNDPAPTAVFGCGTDGTLLNGSILQSFTPDADTLVAVELRLSAGSAFPATGLTAGDTGTTIRILDASDTVLATASVDIAGPIATRDTVLVRWDLGSVAVTPGDSYRIEWATPASGVLGWSGRGDDPYADGTAHSCSGNTWPGGTTDFNFVTYAPEPEPEIEAKDCKTLLKELAADVDGAGLKRRKARALKGPLKFACRALERGKPRCALVALYVFKMRVRFYMRVCWIDHDTGEALIEKANEVRDCIKSGQKA